MHDVFVFKRLQNLKLFLVGNYLLLVVISHNFNCKRFVLNVIIITQLSGEERGALLSWTWFYASKTFIDCSVLTLSEFVTKYVGVVEWMLFRVIELFF